MKSYETTAETATLESSARALQFSTNEIYRPQTSDKPLETSLTAMESAIATLQGGSTAIPLMTIDMHFGRLDNNSGAEISSTSRICSDSVPIETGKSYWQKNVKGVNMFVLLYNASEIFVAFKGDIASGAEIAITEPTAAYMKICSKVGDYDLTNVFSLFDVDPTAGGDSGAKDGKSAYEVAVANGYVGTVTQ